MVLNGPKIAKKAKKGIRKVPKYHKNDKIGPKFVQWNCRKMPKNERNFCKRTHRALSFKIGCILLNICFAKKCGLLEKWWMRIEEKLFVTSASLAWQIGTIVNSVTTLEDCKYITFFFLCTKNFWTFSMLTLHKNTKGFILNWP